MGKAFSTFAALAAFGGAALADGLPYCVVDTGQRQIFSDSGQLLEIPSKGEPFYGQDAFYQGPQFNYRDNGDGTVSDLNTGLMWLRAPYGGAKLPFAEAMAAASKCRAGGHSDWRAPSIKELYSLIDFNGNIHSKSPRPYIDSKTFEFRYGDEAAGERLIDSQYWSSTEYLGTTMGGAATVFGVNFADGRIKGYPRDGGRNGVSKHWLLPVRGNPEYGKNKLVDNGDGTVSDLATGLMWAKSDSPDSMNWEDALAYCAQSRLGGHSDWRLPNVKELQSIVDYGRAPGAKDPERRGPAIDPIFKLHDADSWAWSSTTHLEGPGGPPGSSAAYIAFGKAWGFMQGPDGKRRMDVHGAGAQRSDPKDGDPKAQKWVQGIGPQGDEIRILNYARPLRNIDPSSVKAVNPSLERIPAGRGAPPPRPKRDQ